MKAELVPQCPLMRNIYLNLFGFYLVKWKYWGEPCRENEILAYMLTSLRNKKVGLVPW